jgi:hypothetical protein
VHQQQHEHLDVREYLRRHRAGVHGVRRHRDPAGRVLPRLREERHEHLDVFEHLRPLIGYP